MYSFPSLQHDSYALACSHTITRFILHNNVGEKIKVTIKIYKKHKYIYLLKKKTGGYYVNEPRVVT